MSRTAIALSHVAFEDLGTFETVLASRGYRIHTADACTTFTSTVDMSTPDLLVVLGGPIGAYETRTYPFLVPEIASLRQRLLHQRPTLGICLGAQLMSVALGAKVTPGENGKEIGWSSLTAGADADACPAIRELLVPGVSVLHWHGDTFSLPASCHHLASTARYTNQAWSAGPNLLALQFHPEAIAPRLERWYVDHAAELAAAKVDIPSLRRESLSKGPRLEAAATRFLHAWLDGLQA